MLCAALVLIMLPGLGYFYSGLSHHKNALVFLHLCMLSIAIVSMQWFLWGFSLAFSPTGGPMIGNGHFAGMRNGGGETYPGTTISVPVFAFFQVLFSALTTALPFGSASDRTRILPSMLYMVVWATVVYDFIAYWVWAPNGWLKARGYLDFAGGCPVEVASGFAGLAFALYMGPRRTRPAEEKPHNVGYVVLGTALLWFGWLGFNSGSTLVADRRAGMCMLVTNLAASAGGLAWMFCDYLHNGHKYSAVGFCVGAVAGLVAITPACGFVEPWAGVVIGLVAGVVCRYVADYNRTKGRIDDTLDVFAVHGVGGVIGNILTGVFATSQIIGLDAPGVTGGWLDGNWKQIGIQIYATIVCGAWSFIVTYLTFWVMDKIPGLHLRVKETHETLGLDLAQLGEYAYNYHRAEEGHQPSRYPPQATAEPMDAIDKRSVANPTVTEMQLAGANPRLPSRADNSSLSPLDEITVMPIANGGQINGR
ncbi:ammonium transporter AmtB-like domain-containing protein [Gaertneriomyces semiglobifer]|nr:ammonium transporter AmtB-like domain-containing protein [Gaertneriomyces semiglobifer]